jgi:heterotetrameric sarcosine oxidase beta subunit
VSGLLRGRTFFKKHPMKKSYDVVIIGGGAHGLATAYYLIKNHGITDIAVLEMNYIGAGGSGRNTTIVRSNYRTPEGIRFYERSMELWRGLSADLDFNLMMSNHGHFTLAHTDSSVRVQRERAETNKLLGVDSRLIFRDEIAELCPELNMSLDVPYPIEAALYHPPGSVLRHDAVVWGYGSQANLRGAHIHQGVRVTGIRKDEAGRCVGVDTNEGPIDAGVVMSAVAGWTTQVTDMAGIRTPITNHPLQAFVTEPVKPILHKIIVSANLHTYISQTDRGEILIGSEIEPYTTYNLHRALHGERPGRRPDAGAPEDPAPVDGLLRHDAGLQPDHGRDRGRELLHRRRLGHVGLQGLGGLRRDDGRDARHASHAGADRAVPPEPLRGRDARPREGRGLRLALAGRTNRRDPAGRPIGRPAVVWRGPREDRGR